MLKAALAKDPNDADALFNLGMALSDTADFETSESLLKRFLELAPNSARGWNALGVCHAPMGSIDDAVKSLEFSLKCDPGDPYAFKTLGSLLAKKGGSDEEALKYLKQTAESLPDDPQVWFNLGGLYESLNDLEAADESYLRVLDLAAYGKMADDAKERRSAISENIFRGKGSAGRPDALMYCVGAIQRFAKLPKQEIQTITHEIAVLGMKGLDINDPAEKYSITSIPGKFSGLHLLCIEYVGFKMIDPSLDIGFDLSKEYEAAKKIASEG